MKGLKITVGRVMLMSAMKDNSCLRTVLAKSVHRSKGVAKMVRNAELMIANLTKNCYQMAPVNNVVLTKKLKERMVKNVDLTYVIWYPN